MFFKKKKEDEPSTKENEKTSNESSEETKNDPAPSSGGDISIGQITADLDKLKAQFSSFYEMQKATTERFTRINEQIGELRSMLIERDKDSKYIEAKTTQAIDLVKTVQPDKLMIELRKSDGKIEALRANLESNEAVMNNIVNELKEMRNKMLTFRGIEQVIKLNEEVKGELMEIRKVNATVERHADKVETIFSEVQKRFSDFDKINDVVKDLDSSFKQISSDFDSIKVKMTDFASKKEVENLINKFEAFERNATNVLNLMGHKFERLSKEYEEKLSKKFEETDKLLTGFKTLVQKTPDLDKYFNLLEDEAKKAPQREAKVEKIKELGEEPKEESTTKEKKKGIFSKVKEKLGK